MDTEVEMLLLEEVLKLLIVETTFAVELDEPLPLVVL
jgi:hypothetical protein